MSVRDTWVTLDGRHTRHYGRGRRWQAVWTGPDGMRHAKAFDDRAQAAQYAAEMQAAAMTAQDGGFSLAALVAELTTQQNHWAAENLAAELRRGIPAGQEETALTAALKALAFTVVAQGEGMWRWPGRPRGGRPRTNTQAGKDARALDLHRQGLSYQRIADATGMRSKGSVYLAVQRAIADQARQRSAGSGESPAAA